MIQLIKQARHLLANAKDLCVLSGAGISAESGLQTFRDAGGLWEDHSIADVATPEGFRKDPRRVWTFYNARRKSAKLANPNAAHKALARQENVTVLTQNIDGLHQAAGSRHVIELHGSLWKVRCTGCRQVTEEFPLELPVLPYCARCKALLRPHIVWFGENLDPDVLDSAEIAVEECDLFLVVGTSGVVQPAASYPFMAARRGVPVIEVNKEKTPISQIATISLLGPAGEILPKLIAG